MLHLVMCHFLVEWAEEPRKPNPIMDSVDNMFDAKRAFELGLRSTLKKD